MKQLSARQSLAWGNEILGKFGGIPIERDRDLCVNEGIFKMNIRVTDCEHVNLTYLAQVGPSSGLIRLPCKY